MQYPLWPSHSREPTCSASERCGIRESQCTWECGADKNKRHILSLTGKSPEISSGVSHHDALCGRMRRGGVSPQHCRQLKSPAWGPVSPGPLPAALDRTRRRRLPSSHRNCVDA